MRSALVFIFMLENGEICVHFEIVSTSFVNDCRYRALDKTQDNSLVGITNFELMEIIC